MVIMRLQGSENEASRESTSANRVTQYEDPDINRLLPADGAVGYRNRLVVSAQVCKSGNLAKYSQSPVIPFILFSPEDEIPDPKTRTDQIISLHTLPFCCPTPALPPPPPGMYIGAISNQNALHTRRRTHGCHTCSICRRPEPSQPRLRELLLRGGSAGTLFGFVMFGRARKATPTVSSDTLKPCGLSHMSKITLVGHWMMKPHPSRVYFWFMRSALSFTMFPSSRCKGCRRPPRAPNVKDKLPGKRGCRETRALPLPLTPASVIDMGPDSYGRR